MHVNNNCLSLPLLAATVYIHLISQPQESTDSSCWNPVYAPNCLCVGGLKDLIYVLDSTKMSVLQLQGVLSQNSITLLPALSLLVKIHIITYFTPKVVSLV